MSLSDRLIVVTDTHPAVLLVVSLALILVLASACSSSRAPMPTVESVDLDRFMGDWYVIANIPTRFEVGAHNAVESYQLNDRGEIETTFTFRADSFDGELKTMTPKGFVYDEESKAEWRMQFLWPFKSEYLIVYLDSDYSTTIVGRSKRDYLWIMARTPSVSDETLQALFARAVALGYDRDSIQMVPQQW